MKKILFTVLTVSLMLLCIFAVCSCGGNDDTAAPARFKLDTDTLSLKWNKVSAARSYEVRVSGDERIKTIKATNYSLEYLEPGNYTIEVRALNIDPELEASDWASFEFTREAESGLKYNLINNKTEYELVGSGTAFGDVVMESVYRGKPVTSVADKAFANNRKITSIVIGDNVKTIGKNAFSKCSELTSITIPEGVTTIGEYAFQNCKKLTSINIPNTVTQIAQYTFSWCSELKDVTVGKGVTDIGENAFSNCSALAAITLPDSVKTVQTYAFSDCSALAEVKFGNGMDSVSSYAFFNCGAITSLDLGTSLAEIGLGAFGNCSALEDLTIPDSVVTIGDESFANCTALSEISIGNGVKRIGAYAFYGTIPHASCEGDAFYVDGWLIQVMKTDITGFSAMPEGTIGIADAAFSACKKLEKITIRGIKYIGQGAFANCEKLYQVNADNSLLEIGDYAFYNCTVLGKINVGDSLTKIGDYSFQNCSTLTDDGIDLPATVERIGAYAFYDTGAFARTTLDHPVVYIDDWAVGIKGSMFLSQIDIKEGTRAIANYAFSDAMLMGIGVLLPESLTYIGKGAFYNCYMAGGFGGGKNLEHIDDYAFYNCSSAFMFANKKEPGVAQFPSKLKYIGRSAFYQCTAMIGVKIPGSVEYIGPYAFYGCTNLGDSGVMYESIEAFKNGEPTLKGPVIIEEGVKYIGERAFHGCTGIVEVSLPKSLEYLGSSAFYKCTKLEYVSFGDGESALDIPGYTFYKCENLKTLVISKNIKSIGNYAFRGCTSLENIIMGDMVESIGDYAFYGCTGVKEIYIPTSVNYIGKYAFKGCVRVDAVVIPSDVEVIGKHAFYGLNTATFYCEPATIPAYWNERWNSSYRAVLWGCTLSEDKSYVVSFVKNTDTYDNLSSPDATLTPEKEGYTFAGWSTDPNMTSVTYTADKLAEIPDGTTLYAVWTQVTTD